jgi:hypothetical protein
MQQQNLLLEHIKSEYLLADMNFRTQKINVREFNKILLDIFTHLLTAMDQIEPYYSQFKEASELQFKNKPSIATAEVYPKSRSELAQEREIAEQNLGRDKARDYLFQKPKTQ